MNCFNDPKPLFIAIKNETFIIGSNSYDHIICIIQKAQPVRKFFQNGKLICYSMDAKKSQNKKTYCCFCDQKHLCQRKIRLSMIFITPKDPIPVVLDINQSSFPNFQLLIENIGDDQLKSSPVNLKIIYDQDDRKMIEFSV
jgi:hypothetical protein